MVILLLVLFGGFFLASCLFFCPPTSIHPSLPPSRPDSPPSSCFLRGLPFSFSVHLSPLTLRHPSISDLSSRPIRWWLSSKAHYPPPHLFAACSVHPLALLAISLLAPITFLHFSSKPSRISVCFRAVSSTNLASTFSCSSKGFGAERQEEAWER